MGQAQWRRGAWLLAAYLTLIGAPPLQSTTAQDSEQPSSGPHQALIDDLWALIHEGKYPEAEVQARALLTEVEDEAGPESPEAASVLGALVGALRHGGKANESETLDLVNRALEIREAHFGPSDVRVAWMLGEKSNVLQERGEYSAAEPLLLRALEIYRDLQGPEDPDVAAMHTNLGNLFRMTGQIDRAKEHLATALALYEASSGPTSLDVADALSNLAHVSGAEELYWRSLAIREEILGTEHPSVATGYHHLGYLKWLIGEYEAARPLMERAIEIREKTLGPDHPNLGDSLLNLSLVLVSLAEPDLAEKTLLRSISIHEQGSHYHVSGGYNSYAVLLSERGDLVAARQYVERALDILESTLGASSPQLAWTLGNLCEIYDKLGEWDRSQECFTRALAKIEESLGAEHPTVADTLSSLALVSAKTGNLDEAIRLAERAVAVTEQSFGEENPNVSGKLITLGTILSQNGDYTRARGAFERALAIKAQTLGRDSPAVLSSTVLADLSADLGNCAEAAMVYERALSALQSLRGPNHPEVEDCYRKLAICQARLGRNDEAFENALRSENISREHLRVALTGLAEKVGLRYAATRESGLDLAISILHDGAAPRAVARGFDALIRSRALVLDEMAERWRTVSADKAPDVEPLVDRLQAARNRLAYLAIKRTSELEERELHQRLVERARSDRDRAERELAEQSRDFRLRQKNKRFGLKEVMASLPPGSGLIGFARFQRHVFDRSNYEESAHVRHVPSYLAFVLTERQKEPAMVPLGSAEEIDELVRRVQDHIIQQSEAPDWVEKQALVAYRRDAELLRRRIWDPVEPLLGDVERLFIVPDGALHLVSLAALPVGETRYLIDRGPQLHYLSAERDLVAGSPEPTMEGLLAFSNPDFDTRDLFAALAPAEPGAIARVAGERDADQKVYRGARSGCDSLKRLEFNDLTATETEVRDVIALWRKGSQASGGESVGAIHDEVVHLSREKASETAFKLNAPGRRIVHLATHGFFLGGSCASPATIESPLLRMGLAMAGANHYQSAGPDEDDGILTAEETAALDLRGMEWAVLSACETGLGEVRVGEGVLGLRRAFRIAGARTLIMSLWRVEDEPTRDWMRLLYEGRFVDDMETAEAVHRANLELLRQRRQAGLSTHPFYWAGFIASGDWR